MSFDAREFSDEMIIRYSCYTYICVFHMVYYTVYRGKYNLRRVICEKYEDFHALLKQLINKLYLGEKLNHTFPEGVNQIMKLNFYRHKECIFRFIYINTYELIEEIRSIVQNTNIYLLSGSRKYIICKVNEIIHQTDIYKISKKFYNGLKCSNNCITKVSDGLIIDNSFDYGHYRRGYLYDKTSTSIKYKIHYFMIKSYINILVFYYQNYGDLPEKMSTLLFGKMLKTYLGIMWDNYLNGVQSDSREIIDDIIKCGFTTCVKCLLSFVLINVDELHETTTIYTSLKIILKLKYPTYDNGKDRIMNILADGILYATKYVSYEVDVTNIICMCNSDLTGDDGKLTEDNNLTPSETFEGLEKT